MFIDAATEEAKSQVLENCMISLFLIEKLTDQYGTVKSVT